MPCGGSMDAAEYKHVVLGFIFLPCVADAFAEHRTRLAQEPYAAPEGPDAYRAAGVCWVPPEARWERLQHDARQPEIGRLVDEALQARERDNPSLRGVLPEDYARPSLDKQRRGQLVDLVSNIRVGGPDACDLDVLGRVCEYFLGQFASAEGPEGASSTRPAAWSSCWSRCWSPSREGSTTSAVASVGCSSSPWSLSRLTPPATGDAPRPKLASMARNSTTPPGASAR